MSFLTFAAPINTVVLNTNASVECRLQPSIICYNHRVEDPLQPNATRYNHTKLDVNDPKQTALPHDALFIMPQAFCNNEVPWFTRSNRLSYDR